jgi:PTH1 family peptidyl-tRNA hydrolase
MKNYLIVGLGNIGSEYDNTRHNIGFHVIDAVAEKFNGEWEQGKNAFIATIKIRGRKVLLVKPTTYMNLSGKPVRYYLQDQKLSPADMLIVTDDLSIDYGAIRIRGKGSDGGHNGHKDIIRALGHSNYPRLRFGIGNGFSKGQQVDYVLGKWSTTEKKELPFLTDHCIDAIEAFVFQGLATCMNNFNKKE